MKRSGEFSSLRGLELDSCIVAAHRANSRFGQRQQIIAAKAVESADPQPGRYVADDLDLPEIFLQPMTEEKRVKP
jgi:hypothetical protein